jgi:hypothetical protein
LQVGRLSLFGGCRPSTAAAKVNPQDELDQWSPITSTAALIGQPERGSLAGRVAMT